MVVNIHFNEIVVEKMEEHSGVFIGYNDVNGWNSFSKTQNIVSGENIDIDDSCFIFVDDDYVDTFIDPDNGPRKRATTFQHKAKISHNGQRKQRKKLPCRQYKKRNDHNIDPK